MFLRPTCVHNDLLSYLLQLPSLVHVAQSHHLDSILQIDLGDEKELANLLHPLEQELVSRPEQILGIFLIHIVNLARVDELENFLNSPQLVILDSYYPRFSLHHRVIDHSVEEL